MDELFPILMFIVFFLAPLLEGLKRKKKEGDKTAPPPVRRPLPRTQQQRMPQPSRTEEISAKPRADESAATMVPDDLWEILTGQKRPPVLTTPQEVPQRQPHWDVVYDPEDDEEDLAAEDAALEDVDVETRRRTVEEKSLETYERHPEPIVISLEENIPTAAQRHVAFHKKIALPPPVVQKTILPKAHHHPLFGGGSRAELRRAFLLQEVFNKPKGLE